MWRNQRGFTFVETMVASGILLALSSMTLMWMMGGADLWWTTNTQSELRTNVQLATFRLEQDLRNGTRTSVLVPSPNVVIPAPPNNTSLTLYLPTDLDGNLLIIDANGNTEWSVTPVQYTYNAGAKQLLRTAGVVQTVIANDVQAVSFNDVTSDATLSTRHVKITLTLQKKTPQNRTVTATAVSVVKLRN